MLHDRTDEVTFQHWQTVLDGLAVFLAHPIFGAGIGAYMDQQIRSTGMPLVIHSTPVWLLAETGLIGFGVFLAAAWRLFSGEIRRRGDPAALLLLLLLCGLAVMSSVHEMLYQRGFWLLLGAVLAMPVAAARDDRRN
jgi:O-antigen ligase